MGSPQLAARPVMAGTVTEGSTSWSTTASIPRRWASVEGDSSPASATQWESSNAAAKVRFRPSAGFLVALLTGIFRGMTTMETLVPDTL